MKVPFRITQQKNQDDSAVPRVIMDYFFLSPKDSKASDCPKLVMVDEQMGDKYARAVVQGN